MTENERQIELLILKYARYEPLTGEEMAILKEWRARSAEHDALPDQFRDEGWVQENLIRLNRTPSAQIWQRISEQVKNEKRLITPWYIKVAGTAAAIALIVVAIRAFVHVRPAVEDGRALVAGIPVSGQSFSNPGGKPGARLIVLPDGTRVWLNNASSITYPGVFATDKRVVRLEGEAYFDVAKHPGRPFIVQTSYGSTQDKSTEFNVRAYADEGTGKVTVLEGAVIVNDGNSQVELNTPLQQVQLTRGGMGQTVTLKSADEAVAWKRGMIHFAGTDLRVAMRELSHRYGKILIYKDDVKGVALDQFDVPQETPWEQTLTQVKDLERGVASFAEKGDSVIIGDAAKGN